MLFPTIEFAIFFAIVFPIIWLLNARNAWKKVFLIAASYFFYAFWRYDFALILLASSCGNWAVALLIGRLKPGRLRQGAFWAAVAANLGLLGYFKYYNFFVASLINALAALDINVDIQFIEVALPIAISFLTFHALSYIIDVYKERLKPTTSLIDILLYISFFPHLVAGPIVRAKIFLEQTVHPSDPRQIELAASVFLIVGGLFKKVIIANYLATDFVDDLFRAPTDHTSLDLVLGMYAYAIQIYCDFSAYTDIAIGTASLLGYRFPQNFNQPYRALTVQDFWRRWHITLSTWLRDYLYIPLGGNRGGTLATYRNILITMGLGGLWHGASFNFVIWGLLHGGALVIERMLGISADDAPKRSWPVKVALWLITFNLVCFAWVFFRAASLDDSMAYFATMFAGGTWSTAMTPLVAVCLLFGAITQIIPPDWARDLKLRYELAPIALKVAAPFVVIYLIAIAAPRGVPPFIYFQF